MSMGCLARVHPPSFCSHRPVRITLYGTVPASPRAVPSRSRRLQDQFPFETTRGRRDQGQAAVNYRATEFVYQSKQINERKLIIIRNVVTTS